MNEVAKTSFAELNSKISTHQAKELSLIALLRRVNLNELPPIDHVTWLNVSALGDKTVKMLAQEGYYDLKRERLSLKYKQTPYADLDRDLIHNRLKTKPEEFMSNDLAMRRLAAGFGKSRELAYLLDLLSSENALSTLDSRGGANERTPLHWALQSKKGPKAACWLLEKGASIHVPDKNGKTPKMQFEESQDPKITNNGYLKAKFGNS